MSHRDFHSFSPLSRRQERRMNENCDVTSFLVFRLNQALVFKSRDCVHHVTNNQMKNLYLWRSIKSGSWLCIDFIFFMWRQRAYVAYVFLGEIAQSISLNQFAAQIEMIEREREILLLFVYLGQHWTTLKNFGQNGKQIKNVLSILINLW